jgi:MEMO1 family protein
MRGSGGQAIIEAVTRRPAVAGRFYPRDPTKLAAMVDRLLDAVEVPDGEPLAAAYVVPHAGYVFSGPTAALVYARFRRHAGQVEQVVLVGPAHFVPLTGCAAPASGAWTTPLGELPVMDRTGLAEHLRIDDAPHAPEHSLEVQLPFLQRALGRPVPILPIAVGRANDQAVAATVAAAVAGAGAGTVVLCSTDLSHYLDQAAAMDRDARTANAIEDLAPERIGVRDACGLFALRGVLAWARTGPLRPAVLGLATSADTGGDPYRVVGYGAFRLLADLGVAQTGLPG